MEEFYENIRKTIQSHGFQIIGVSGEHNEPNFQYTIGLTEKFGFEIIVFALPYHIGGIILNDLVNNHGKPELNIPYDKVTTLPVMFKEANDVLVREYAVQAFRYYEKPLKFVQMVLCDRNGKFPDDPGFDHEYMDHRQPILCR